MNAAHRAPRRYVPRTPGRLLAAIERAQRAGFEREQRAIRKRVELEAVGQRHAVEVEAGKSVRLHCDCCNQWIAIGDWRRHSGTGCPGRMADLEGRN